MEHPLGVDARWLGTTLSIRLAGELDLSSRGSLAGYLVDGQAPERVVVDVESLEFIDSTGLRELYDLAQTAAARGFDLVIVGAHGPVRRMMRLTGLDAMLPLADADGTV